MKLSGQGWSAPQTHRNALIAVFALMAANVSAFAGPLTVRDIQIKGKQINIQLDGVSPKGAVDLDYVRDIVQFSLPNTSIYPAKILHAENQSFSKVFAYQYAPNLVRVRFSVDGQATAFKGKVKWQQKGKVLTVSFPDAGSVETAKKDDSDLDEKSLLQKVLSAAKKEEVKVEEIKPEKAEPVKAETKVSKKLTGNPNESEKTETKHPALAGQAGGPSVMRSFFAMFLVVGGLGLVLVYVKKKKNSAQARKVGDSWISNLLPNSMKKQKSFIEVVAQHGLGPKHSITVVKIKGQQFVLAVTPENVQLITQLDSDDSELDLLEDPAVAASIGKIFGAKPAVQAVPTVPSASFNTMLKNSNGAGAIVARNAYAAQSAERARGLTQQVPAIQAQQSMIQNPSRVADQNGVREQIRKRLEGMKNA